MGWGRESNIVSALVETVTRLVVQELLEAEQADFLGGRGRYGRRGQGQVGSRNGYEPRGYAPLRACFDVALPQARDAEQPFRSSLMGSKGNSEVLERWLVRCMRASVPRQHGCCALGIFDRGALLGDEHGCHGFLTSPLGSEESARLDAPNDPSALHTA